MGALFEVERSQLRYEVVETLNGGDTGRRAPSLKRRPSER